MQPRTITITLKLTVDGDEVDGTARAAEGEDRDFHGWMGLVGAIDTIVAAGAGAGAGGGADAAAAGRPGVAGGG